VKERRRTKIKEILAWPTRRIRIRPNRRRDEFSTCRDKTEDTFPGEGGKGGQKKKDGEKSCGESEKEARNGREHLKGG